MTLRTFLGAVRRYWRTFASVSAAVFVIALAWILLTPVKYVSTAQLMVSISGSTTAAAYQNDDVVTSRVNSYIPLLTSEVVSQRVVDELGLPITAGELAEQVSAMRVPPNTSIIDLAVTADSPDQARRLADAYAAEFVAYATALETPTGEDGQKVHVTTITSATQPHGNVLERVILGGLGALLAALLGAVAVWIRAVTDPVIRNTERAADAAGMPVLGSVKSDPVVSPLDLDASVRLRAAFKPVTDSGARVFQVVSADNHLDAAVVATNLGHALRAVGRRCLVLTLRAANPVTGVAQHHTLDGVIADKADDVGMNPSDDTISIDPDAEAIQAAGERIRQLMTAYDNIVIACPPPNSAPAAVSALSEYADDVIVLCSLDLTTRTDLSRTAQHLRQAGASPAGVVVVRTTDELATLHCSEETMGVR